MAPIIPSGRAADRYKSGRQALRGQWVAEERDRKEGTFGADPLLAILRLLAVLVSEPRKVLWE